MTTSVDSGIQEISVPEAAARLGLLASVDYEDAFSATSTAPRNPERLMRDVLEGAPTWFLHSWSLLLGRAILGNGGLNLRQSPDRVVGWKVLVNREDIFAVGIDTPRGLNARLFTLRSPDQEIIGTQIQLTSEYARRWWPTIRAGHRFFLPFLLRRSLR
ncbi:MAG TPA: hypothetical protein VM093_02650 [Aeromicrobium sp.]|nr:hypothetical protein [Aeromicrobium sp.]